MNSVQLPDGYRNLWDLPNLLLQKFPADQFMASAKVKINSRFEGERFGLVVMGLDYSYLGVTNRGGKLYISQVSVMDADKGSAETETKPILLPTNEVILSVGCRPDAGCAFQYSLDGKTGYGVAGYSKPRAGRWIGAKIGFFFTRPGTFNDAGSADIDWLRFRIPLEIL
jgi:hypothetical protein